MTNKLKPQKRFREYGFKVGLLLAGLKNSITDVKGIKVGHYTKIKGKNIRTGITLIDPGIKNLFTKKIPAAIQVGNGFGKITGITQVEELGTLEAPIALTNTLAVGAVMRGVVDLVLKNTSRLSPMDSINVVVGETNDSRLNDIHQDSLSKKDVERAYKALTDKVHEGNIGAGTGTRLFSWKGGIGTASRIVKIGNKKYTLGALVQTNYGGALTILGIPIGQILGKTDFTAFSKDNGSCMMVLATDAPLSARQLKRISGRAFLGMARTGSIMSAASGDYAIAFSTNRQGLEGEGQIGKCIKDKELTNFFLAAVEAVEESVYNALFAAQTLRGRKSNILKTIPVEKTVKILKSYKS